MVPITNPQAGEFPTKPIKLIVPFPPGGGSDISGRLLKRAIDRGKVLPESFVIVNVPGGGGTIGSRRVKNAAPDGHTLLLLHEGIFTARHAGQTTYGPEAFEPVIGFGSSGIVLVVADGSPLQSLSDLVDHCRENPDQLTFACNLGAPAHFIGLQLQKAAGDIRFRFVPSGGGSKRFKDLIGGQVEATIFSAAEFAEYRGGGIRALAFLRADRHRDFPDIPTAEEQGVSLEAANLQFVWAPKSTPDDIIHSLAGSLRTALSAPETVKELTDLHIDPVIFDGEELRSNISARETAIASVATANPEVFPWFPHTVAGLCILLIVGLAFGKRKRTKAVEPVDRMDRISIHRCAGFVISSTAYGIALGFGAPFIVATVGFTVVASLFLIGRQGWSAIRFASVAVLALSLGFGCHFIFSRFLSIDLP